MINYGYLNWDSDFFGLRICKIEVLKYNKPKIENEIRLAFMKGNKLIYLIIPEEIDQKLLFQSKLVDNKVVFSKNIKMYGHTDTHITAYESTIVTEDLYALAFESGRFSRFKTDKGLPSGSFEQLYSLWIENSIKSEIADKVFVYKLKQEILGMVTLKIYEGHGEIGLISSSVKNQGKGVGSKLLAHCENYLLSLDINRIEVATQSKNVVACSFYKKNGYSIVKSLNYYHIWSK